MAIEEAQKSVPEDERDHPKVGAVVVKDGKVISKAHRGESPKSHAEYIALEGKLLQVLVAGATVYTTLEPCTTRKHPKIPCAQRLVDRNVARVVIGMLDPNPDIRGLGEQLLNEAGIETQLFPRDLRAKVEEMNRDFIRAQKQRTAKAVERRSAETQASEDHIIQARFRIITDTVAQLNEAEKDILYETVLTAQMTLSKALALANKQGLVYHGDILAPLECKTGFIRATFHGHYEVNPEFKSLLEKWATTYKTQRP